MATAAACCPSVLYANTWAASNFEGDMTTANSGPVFVVDAQPFVVGSPCGAAIEVTAFVATASNYNLFDPPPLDHYPLSWYLILAVVDVATDDLVLFSGDVDSCPFQQPGGGPIFGVYPASTWARVAGVLPPGAYELTCFYACEAPTAATGTPVLFSWQVDVGAVLWTGPPGTWGSVPADGASPLTLTAPSLAQLTACQFTSIAGPQTTFTQAADCGVLALSTTHTYLNPDVGVGRVAPITLVTQTADVLPVAPGTLMPTSAFALVPPPNAQPLLESAQLSAWPLTLPAGSASLPSAEPVLQFVAVPITSVGFAPVAGFPSPAYYLQANGSWALDQATVTASLTPFPESAALLLVDVQFTDTETLTSSGGFLDLLQVSASVGGADPYTSTGFRFTGTDDPDGAVAVSSLTVSLSVLVPPGLTDPIQVSVVLNSLYLTDPAPVTYALSGAVQVRMFQLRGPDGAGGGLPTSWTPCVPPAPPRPPPAALPTACRCR